MGESRKVRRWEKQRAESREFRLAACNPKLILTQRRKENMRTYVQTGHALSLFNRKGAKKMLENCD
jgi:hypothetical protein